LDHSRHIFVLTLSRHRIFGNLLVPFFAEQNPGEPFLRLVRRVKQFDLTDPDNHFTPVEIRTVKITERYSDERIIRKFCPDKPVGELQNILRNEETRKKLVSYIENTLSEVLELVKVSVVPLYQKREKYMNLYAEDLITLCFRDTGAVFNFHRMEQETRYFLSLRNGNEYFSLLHRNIEILVNEPCRIYFQNKIYYFDNISASKLLPFREKEFISIPKKMEDKYYGTFILNSIKSQEVRFRDLKSVNHLQ